MAQLRRWLDAARQDFSYAIRGLRRDPRFATMVIITLALAIGANAALFSMVDRLFFRQPSGVARPADLRRIYGRTNWTVGGVTEITDVFGFAQFDAVRSAVAGRVDLAAYTVPDSVPIGDGDGAISARGVFATSNFLPLVGARLALGRTFNADEDRMGSGADVAVISYRLWQHQFAGNPAILGRAVSIARQKLTVIGVTAEGFDGIDLDPIDLWLPLAKFPPDREMKVPWYQSWRYGQIVRAIARTSPSASDAWIGSVATTAFRRGELANVEVGPDTATLMTGPLLAALGPSITPKTEVAIATRLAGVVAIVLLIACANVANLLLVRGMKRRRELAVRVALGVSRSRLIMVPVLEALALSLGAAVVAILIAAWGGTALARMVLPAGDANTSPFDWRVGVFTIVVALLTGIVGSVGPALRAVHPDVIASLKAGAREGGAQRSQLRATLLASQAALSVLLLVGAGLFVRSLTGARSIDLGMDTEHMIIGRVTFYDQERHVRDNSPHMHEITDGMRSAAATLATVPGVRASALATNTPFRGWIMTRVFLDGGRVPPRLDNLDPALIVVTKSYFAATGMKLVAGRTFNDDDVPGPAKAVVVNETAARAYWPGENAVGKCIVFFNKTEACSRVVGIVRDAHYEAVVEKAMVGLFTPSEQYTGGVAATPTTLVVRTSPGATAGVANQMRRILRATFPTAEPPSVAFTADGVDTALKPWRLGAMLFTMFGLLALIVAAVGIYSVISYSVSQRVHEIGVRMALGAHNIQIAELVTGEGLRAVAVGIVIGLAASLAMGRLVASMLYDTSTHDPIVMSAVIATLLIVAIAASVLPAWRAASIDPAAALRAD